MFHVVRCARWSSRLFFTVGLLVLAAAPFRSVSAQSGSGATGISGVVLDPDGQAIVNAAVIVRNVSTNDIRTTTSDATGRFSVADLPAGVYAVEVMASGFATARRDRLQLVAGGSQNITVSLSVAPLTEQVDVSAAVPPAEKYAPSETPLTAQSAQSVISGEYIRDFTSPVADFAEVVQMVPGAFSLNPNGIGLGQGKTYFRGFADGQYTMTFDAIPFEDTNSPTHHSWAFFPGQQIGGAVFDRSPGSAATLGPANFGGSINLLSRNLQPQFDGTASSVFPARPSWPCSSGGAPSPRTASPGRSSSSSRRTPTTASRGAHSAAAPMSMPTS
jgi:iron complex outermembrane receptor protein